MFTLTPKDLTDKEDKENTPTSSSASGTFFNQHPVVEDDGFCGGLDEDLWWEDDQQDFDFGNF